MDTCAYYTKVSNETDIRTLVLIKQKCPMKQTDTSAY